MPESEKLLPTGKYERHTGTLNRKRGKREKPYQKLNPLEQRGLPEGKNKEYNVQRAFWRRNKMDHVMQLAGQDLDTAIDKFFEDYEKTQIKGNKRWWYPEVIRIKDIRNLDIRNKK